MKEHSFQSRMRLHAHQFASGVALAAALHLSTAVAATETVLFSFPANGRPASDTQLLLDPAGNLYGAGSLGSPDDVVFELIPNSEHTEWTFKTLHTFCRIKCSVAETPDSSPIMDTSGNLYGTTYFGGSADEGTVYKLTPNGDTWSINALHSFSGNDGAYPQFLYYFGQETGALYDGVSPLYGVTNSYGGGNYGAVFKLTPPSSGHTKWSLRTIYSFCYQNCRHPDGQSPTGLVGDTVGDLFGTTVGGGKPRGGIIYELRPSGKKWKETILCSFSRRACKGAATPFGAPAIDPQGNIFGTTVNGKRGGGTLYEQSGSTHTVLYQFCSKVNCKDGSSPYDQLLLDSSGNLFGSTYSGGSNNGGILFEFSNSAESVLFDFGANANPTGGVIRDSTGNLYGMTTHDGANGAGTVYEITP